MSSSPVCGLGHAQVVWEEGLYLGHSLTQQVIPLEKLCNHDKEGVR